MSDIQLIRNSHLFPLYTKVLQTNPYKKYQLHVYLLFEEPDSSRQARLLSLFLICTIVYSVVTFLIETIPDKFPSSQGNNTGDFNNFFFVSELVATMIFTIEYLLRLWACKFKYPSRWAFAKDTLNFLDLLATIPLYIDLIFKSSNLEALRVLRTVRLARVFRLFKLSRYSFGMGVMVTALYSSLPVLNILIFFLFVAVIIFSAAIYLFEKIACPEFTVNDVDKFISYSNQCGVFPETTMNADLSLFGDGESVRCCRYWCSSILSSLISYVSAPTLSTTCEFGAPFNGGNDWPYQGVNAPPSDAFALSVYANGFYSIVSTTWLVSVSMATVGYGDSIPITTFGKIMNGFALLCGIMVLAMPIAILGSRFQDAYDLKDKERKLKEKEEQKLLNRATAPHRPLMSPLQFIGKFGKNSFVTAGNTVSTSLRIVNVFRAAQHQSARVTPLEEASPPAHIKSESHAVNPLQKSLDHTSPTSDLGIEQRNSRNNDLYMVKAERALKNHQEMKENNQVPDRVRKTSLLHKIIPSGTQSESFTENVEEVVVPENTDNPKALKERSKTLTSLLRIPRMNKAKMALANMSLAMKKKREDALIVDKEYIQDLKNRANHLSIFERIKFYNSELKTLAIDRHAIEIEKMKILQQIIDQYARIMRGYYKILAIHRVNTFRIRSRMINDKLHSGDDNDIRCVPLKYRVCDKSLYVFDKYTSRFRKICIDICSSYWFDRVVFILIIINSIFLAMQNYRDPEASINSVVESGEIVFTILFTLEMVIKIVALGFVMDKWSYLRDTWNWLDFLVVTTALLSIGLNRGSSSTTVLRVFRVLRPLRSLSALPGMRVLVNSVLLSLPKLGNVAAMAIFLLTIFGILGLQIWGGVTHRRCRMTPTPIIFVNNNDSCVLNTQSTKCVSQSSFPMFYEAWCTQDCQSSLNEGETGFLVWPVDQSQTRLCGARYSCGSISPDSIGNENINMTTFSLEFHSLFPGFPISETTCGSCFTSDDEFGFSTIDFYHRKICDDTTRGFDPANRQFDLNFGLSHFDNLLVSFIVIFQSITLEGWTGVMYLLMDGGDVIWALVYFGVLVLVGSFFLLNVTLAIVWESFNSLEAANAQARMKKIKERKKHAQRHNRKRGSLRRGSTNSQLLSPSSLPMDREAYCLFGIGSKMKTVDRVDPTQSVLAISYTEVKYQIKILHNILAKHSKAIARSLWFSVFITLIIIFNVLTLSFDRFPPLPPKTESFLNTANNVFTVCFIFEFIVMHFAIGVRAYWKNLTSAFDGIIVLFSILEFFLQGGSTITALRAFRLLRIFKLAKKWTSFRLLLKAIIETVKQMGNFVLLLFLMMFVFTLLGQAFFATEFRFNDEGLKVPIDDINQCPPDPYSNSPSCIPRSNFDTFFDGIITVFQILSGEDWHIVMYYGILARGWTASVYFVSLVIIGNFVILNLFLAILMGNFEQQNRAIREKEKKQRESRQKLVQSTTKKQKVISAFMLPPPPPVELKGVSTDIRKSSTEVQFQSSSQLTQNLGDKALTSNDLDSHDLLNVTNAVVMPTAFPNNSTMDPVPYPFKQEKQKIIERSDNIIMEQSTTDKLKYLIEARKEIRIERSTLDENNNEYYNDDNDDQLSSVSGSSTVRHNNDSYPSNIMSDDDVLSNFSSNRHIGRQREDFSRQLMNRLRLCLSEFFVSLRIYYLEFYLWSGRKMAWSKPARDWLSFHSFRIVNWAFFDKIILSAIVISSILTALSNPLDDPRLPKERWLFILNVFFTIVFTIEMILKISAYGFLFSGKNAYIRNSWNVLDFTIVFFSLLDLLIIVTSDSATPIPPEDVLITRQIPNIIDPNESYFTEVQFESGGGAQSLSALKTIRVLRALRPLRLISRNPNLKLVVSTLLKSVPELCNLVFVAALFFLIFGLFGVSYFKGSFYSCNQSEGGTGIEPFVFNLSIETTPLCPTTNLTNNLYVTSCDNTNNIILYNSTSPIYQRPTFDTPICLQKCHDDVSNLPSTLAQSVCQNVPHWGYHTLKCSDCASFFCGSAEASQNAIDNDCDFKCRDWPSSLFCRSTCDEYGEYSDQCNACVSECVSQCSCSKYCSGYSKQAALCIEQGGKWVNFDQNFDTIGNGILTLLELATTEGWVNTMNIGVDRVGFFMEPIQNNQRAWALYFAAFILIGAFFVLNLCVGVIINNFNKIRQSTGGSVFLTEKQRAWTESKEALFKRGSVFIMTNLHKLGHYRRIVYDWVMSTWFETIIMSSIILNTIVMGLTIFPEVSPTYTETLSAFNLFFAIIFNIEAILKIFALRKQYFKTNWNRFDFIVVIATDISLITADSGATFSTLRIFRIARLFRLIKFARGLNQLFSAFIFSLPKLANVAILLCLLLFLYAVLGVSLFAKIREFGAHSDQANFQSFWLAIVTLVRSMTGEAWNELMHAYAKDQFFFESILDRRCVNEMVISDDNYDILHERGLIENPIECGTKVAFIFFVSFTLIVTFAILNLFIAVIFEGFDESQKNEEGEILSICISQWKKYDLNLSMTIPLESAVDFVSSTALIIQSNRKKQRRNLNIARRLLLNTRAFWERHKYRITPIESNNNTAQYTPVINTFSRKGKRDSSTPDDPRIIEAEQIAEELNHRASVEEEPIDYDYHPNNNGDSPLDFHDLDLHGAQVLRLWVNSNNQVNFYTAVAAVMRLIITKKDKQLLSEIEEFESKQLMSPRLRLLELKHNRKVSSQYGAPVSSLEELVAARRIQRQFKERLERKRRKS